MFGFHKKNKLKKKEKKENGKKKKKEDVWTRDGLIITCEIQKGSYLIDSL